MYNYEKLFEIMNLNHYWTAHQWLNLSPVSNSHRSGINGQCFSLFWQYLIADSDCSQGSGSPDSFTPFYPINPLHFYLNSMWLCTVIMLNVVNVELRSQGVFYPVSLWFFVGCSLKSQRFLQSVYRKRGQDILKCQKRLTFLSNWNLQSMWVK